MRAAFVSSCRSHVVTTELSESFFQSSFRSPLEIGRHFAQCKGLSALSTRFYRVCISNEIACAAADCLGLAKGPNRDVVDVNNEFCGKQLALFLKISLVMQRQRHPETKIYIVSSW